MEELRGKPWYGAAGTGDGDGDVPCAALSTAGRILLLPVAGG